MEHLLDMSLHGICIYGKAANLSLWACCLSAQAYHMPTHIKSLSRHNISEGSRFWNGGSTQTGLAALPHKNIHLRNANILDIWSSPVYQKLRKTIGEDRALYPFCEGCDFVDAGIRNEFKRNPL